MHTRTLENPELRLYETKLQKMNVALTDNIKAMCLRRTCEVAELPVQVGIMSEKIPSSDTTPGQKSIQKP